MHISDQGWMSGVAWELLISGSVLVLSCLRIHSNKGQQSRATELTRPVFLYFHISTCLLPLLLLSEKWPHTNILFLFFCLSHSLLLSHSPPDLWSHLGSQNTSKQFLSNGPLLKQSVERPEEDDWSLTSGSMHSYESLDQPRWRERKRETRGDIEREGDLSENWYSCVYSQTRHLSNVKTCRQPLDWVWCWRSFGMTTAFMLTHWHARV